MRRLIDYVSTTMITVVAESEWTVARAAHIDRIERLVGDYLADRGRGTYHPVLDFLFTYYSFKPGHLKRWGPGYGVVLGGEQSADYAGFASYEPIDLGFGPAGYRVRGSLLEQRRSAIWDCSPRRRSGNRIWAASGCTSGQWCTEAVTMRYATARFRSASDTRAPTRWWSR